MQIFYLQFGNTKPSIAIAHGLYGCSDNWVSEAKIPVPKFVTNVK